MSWDKVGGLLKLKRIDEAVEWPMKFQTYDNLGHKMPRGILFTDQVELENTMAKQ